MKIYPDTYYWDHPRLRGEYFVLSVFRELIGGSPPLARGVLSLYTLRTLHNGITPACAGSTCLRYHTLSVSRDHPRLRGEYLVFIRVSRYTEGSPPLARGVPLPPEREMHSDGITPACAGSTMRMNAPGWEFRDHPRLRGEYSNDLGHATAIPGSPPLARGVRIDTSVASADEGITPACAGSTR